MIFFVVGRWLAAAETKGKDKETTGDHRSPLRKNDVIRCRGGVPSPAFYEYYLYNKGLLIHRKRSPFPDKGRLVGIVSKMGDSLKFDFRLKNVGGDVLDAPYGHKVTFISKRTVGDACPYNS